MKIAVISPWYPSAEHPVEGIFVMKEVQALRQAGIDARVIHLARHVSSSTQETYQGIPTARLNMNVRRPWSIVHLAGQLRAAAAFAPIIHTHALPSIPAVLAARLSQKWIHTEHWSSLTAPESAEPILRPFIGLLAFLDRLPDVAVAESERLAHALRRVRGNRPVAVIPCIVPAPAQLIERRQDPQTMRLSSTGGLIDRKDPLLAVRVLDELRTLGVDATLRWIGQGPLQDDAEQLAATLAVDAQFLGTQPPEVVQAEIAASDYFLAPTKGENFFVAAGEALVNGRPLCSSIHGGHVEYADPRFSELLDQQTPAAYAQALLRLRDKTRGITAAEISSSVAQRFAAPTVAEEYRRLYQEML